MRNIDETNLDAKFLATSPSKMTTLSRDKPTKTTRRHAVRARNGRSFSNIRAVSSAGDFTSVPRARTALVDSPLRIRVVHTAVGSVRGGGPR